MDDAQIHSMITQLVGEERDLRAVSGRSPEQLKRLQQLEASLDQCWDLLRQREALRDAGADPDGASARPASQVEGYLQ